MTGRKKCLWGILIAVFLLIHAAGVHAEETVIYEEGFETGFNGWASDNGVWDVCLHDPPQPSWGGGLFYVSTVCDEYYEGYTDSRLISPSIIMPAITGDEELHLRFWQWFSYSTYDAGYIQVSVWDETAGSWSGWVSVGNSIVNTSPVWSLMDVDLSAYAGQKIRVAFYHTAERDYYDHSSESYGWHIDDVKIVTRVSAFGGNFESGWEEWSADRGLWEVGVPTAGPAAAHNGAQCAGTVLGGTYPGYTDSRLISPSIIMPAITGDEELHLRFWQWFSYSTYDAGYIQVSVWDETTGSWSGWVSVGNSIADTSPVWSLMDVDLSAYAGQKIRVAFYHTAERDYYDHSSESYGWYIDDVEFVSMVPEISGDFESGWEEWSADRGLWEVGVPTAGPAAAHNGSQCAGTVLGGTYPGYTDSRLISPSIIMPAITGVEELHLRFWQWFSYSTYDAGYIQVSVWDETAGSWSGWVNVGNSIVNTSPVWSLMDVDLSAYAGQKIRVAFYHTAERDYYDHSSESYGWYIDDVEWFKKIPELTWDFECGWDDWSSDRGLWEVGTPTYGPSACYSGAQCAGTVLGGTYPGYTDSRLISPSTWLPMLGDYEELSLSFRHWFSYSTYDAGQVQISVWDEAAETWSNWVSVGNSIVNTSPVWSSMNVDLTAYAGRKIRIAFYHTAERDYYDHSSESAGWYIDHVRITGFPHFCECDLNQDTLCDMPDWLVFGGDWGRTDCNEVDVPPCECDLNHDGTCNMLDWLRFGENWGQSDCVICEQ